MENYFTKILVANDFEAAVTCVVEVLQSEGFSVVSDVDMAAAFSGTVDDAFRNYRILGVCELQMARYTLALDDKSRRVVPYNVVVQELRNGSIEVSVADPVNTVQVMNDSDLAVLVADVSAMLEAAIGKL